MKYFLFCICILFSNLSHSAFFTGNQMLNFCEAKENDDNYMLRKMTCIGYLSAVHDDIKYEIQSGIGPKVTLCLNDVTPGQLSKIFVNYANNHPESLNSPANIMARVSLYNAFNCK